MQMAEDLDLTFLTPEEINHLKGVLERAKKVESIYKVNKEIRSDDVIRSKWKQNQATARIEEDYVPACDALSAALNDEMMLSSKKEGTKLRGESCSTDYLNINQAQCRSEDDFASSSGFSTSYRYLNDIDFSESSSSSPSVSRRGTMSGPHLLYATRSREEMMSDSSPVNTLRKHSTLPRYTPSDTTSMISRGTLPSRDYVGSIDLTLTYFPPGSVKQKTFPQKGTRFSENKNLDILTRKTYALQSGAKISISKERKSGARCEEDGELHLLIRGAYDLDLPSGIRREAKTYVKCYLLPDRYHGSKMKSELYKDSINPRYEHRFVFRGFSEVELNERSIEVIVGGVTSAHGRHLVIGGIRLSNGIQSAASPVPWKDTYLDEVSLWKKVFDQPSSEVSASVALRPKIKLTYK